MTQEKIKTADAGSLGKGLHLLTLLQQALQPLSLSEIAEAAQMPPSSAHRLMKTLCDLGYAYQNGSGRYDPSPRALLPLALEHPLNILRRDSLHLLESLRSRYGLSAKLVVFMGTSRTIVDVALGHYSITPYFDTHDLAPWHASVSGKLLLSTLTPDERDMLLGSAPYTRITRHTEVDREVLFGQLDEIARSGYATNFDENIMGVSTIGVRLLAASERSIGALLLTGPSEYFNASKLEEMREDLFQIAKLLSKTSLSMRALARLLGI